ncbi:hypothetical protein D3C85_1651380 [compost metagenome]
MLQIALIVLAVKRFEAFTLDRTVEGLKRFHPGWLLVEGILAIHQQSNYSKYGVWWHQWV